MQWITMFLIIFSLNNKHAHTPVLLSVISTVAAPVDTDAAPTHSVYVYVDLLCVLFWRSFVIGLNHSKEEKFGVFAFADLLSQSYVM